MSGVMKASDWHRLVATLRTVENIDAMTEAAKELQNASTEEDVPQLVGLHEDDSFYALTDRRTELNGMTRSRV